MKIKEIVYKNIEIELGCYTEHSPMKFYASSAVSIHDGFNSEELLEKVKKDIDAFEALVPGNYEELAEAIYKNCLVWSGYEECDIDPAPLKILIGSFIKSKGGNP